MGANGRDTRECGFVFQVPRPPKLHVTIESKMIFFPLSLCGNNLYSKELDLSVKLDLRAPNWQRSDAIINKNYNAQNDFMKKISFYCEKVNFLSKETKNIYEDKDSWSVRD